MEIQLPSPVKYKTLNGTTMRYNCLISTYDQDHNITLTLSLSSGCPLHNEIRITTKNIKAPDGYFTLRPNMAFSTIVYKALEDLGVLVRHPEGKTVHKGFIDYPLYSLTIPQTAESRIQPVRVKVPVY